MAGKTQEDVLQGKASHPKLRRVTRKVGSAGLKEYNELANRHHGKKKMR